MFGHNHFETPNKATSTEKVTPAKTTPETLELLKSRVSSAIQADPALYAALTSEDIDLVVNSLAVTQEKETGVPYTDAMIEDENDSDGLIEEALAVANARIAAKVAAKGGGSLHA